MRCGSSSPPRTRTAASLVRYVVRHVGALAPAGAVHRVGRAAARFEVGVLHARDSLAPQHGAECGRLHLDNHYLLPTVTARLTPNPVGRGHSFRVDRRAQTRPGWNTLIARLYY